MSVPEIKTKSSVCGKCGAEVRADSQFCYNCGGQLGDEPTNGKPQAENEMKPAPGLRTARDIKRRERSFQRKSREVVWEPSIGTANAPLFIVTGAVALFTILVIVFAFYFR